MIKLKDRPLQILGSQVLLIPEEKKQDGLIIIPETAKQPERLDYFVAALGPEAKEAYPCLEKGMRVIIKKFHEQYFTYEDQEYILTHVDNVVGMVTE